MCSTDSAWCRFGWRVALRTKIARLLNHGAISISIVGSDAEPIELNRWHDVDLLMIAQEPTLAVFQAVRSQLEQIAVELQLPDVSFRVEDRLGVFAREKKNAREYDVQLHLLFFTHDDFRSRSHIPPMQSWWLVHEHIAGNALAQLFPPPRPDSIQILRHIQYQLDVLRSGVSQCYELSELDGKLVRQSRKVTLCPDTIADVCIGYTLKTVQCIRSLLAYPGNTVGDEASRSFRSVVNDHTKFLDWVQYEHSRLKAGQAISLHEITRLKEGACLLLIALATSFVIGSEASI